MRALILLAPLALIACEKEEMRTGMPMASGRTASASLVTATGQAVGTARVTEVTGGLRVTIDGRSMPPGEHGAHLHAVGRCDAPSFESAAAHWNPGATKHGTMNPAGPHAGDLPNLTVGPDGRGTLAMTLAGATMDALLDADGATMIVHAAADDMMTDPSGNSGGRIACGIVRAS